MLVMEISRHESVKAAGMMEGTVAMATNNLQHISTLLGAVHQHECQKMMEMQQNFRELSLLISIKWQRKLQGSAELHKHCNLGTYDISESHGA